MKRIVALGLVVCACFAACSDNTGGPGYANQPPTVWLSAAPPEGSTSKYRVQLFWGGWDPDGEIGHYEYLISDNLTGIFNPADTVGVPWTPVVGNDSTFTFSADSLIGGTPDPTKPLVKYFARSHTFFIRAVDREGLRSREPAYRSFTSRTLSPEVIVDAPAKYFLNPSKVPAISTFRWHARDYVDDVLISQDPDSVQWIFTPIRGGYTATLDSIRAGRFADEWYPWVWYKAPGDSGKFWTTPVMDVGAYVFAIRAKDEAGAVTPVFDLDKNVRFVQVSAKTDGPLMTASNPYLGVIRTVSCTTGAVILDMPAGVPLQFKITGDASSYGGTVTGYRYGWDISDLTDPEQWEIDYTPFPGTCPIGGKDIPCVALPARTFFFGVHTISMEVIDNSGYCARIEVKVNVVPFTLERSLLIVDDDLADAGAGWVETNGTYPSDAEQDAFWVDMVSGVAGFDPVIDVVSVTTTTAQSGVPLTTIARYKSIIFVSYGDFARKGTFPLLYNYIQFRSKDPAKATAASGKVLPNVVALTMAAGSHLMIAGREPIQYVINRTFAGGAKYPLIFQYELEGKQTTTSPPDFNNPVGDLSFAYKDLCLETIEFAPLVTAQLRNSTGKYYCDVSPRFGTRNDQSFGLRTARPLDPNFPTLNLRPEAADPGKTYAPGSQSLAAEIYNASYFRKPFCDYVPSQPRSCFEPIYGLGSQNTTAKTYNEPIAFWTSVYKNVVAEVPGAVGARSIVFGFNPVFFNPSEVKPAIEHVLYDEWQLPRDTNALKAGAGAGENATLR